MTRKSRDLSVETATISKLNEREKKRAKCERPGNNGGGKEESEKKKPTREIKHSRDDRRANDLWFGAFEKRFGNVVFYVLMLRRRNVKRKNWR